MKQLLLLLLLLRFPAYSQQDITALKAEQKLPVLNDRASFLFPAGATNAARQADIMSAGPNADRETRIITDIGAKRLVFFTEELYATAGNNLATGMRASLGKKYTVTETKRPDGLVLVLCTPRTYDSTQNAILINSLVVKTPDNLVFRTNAYINPEAFADRLAFQQLSEKVFRSLEKGKRKLNTTARKENMAILEGQKNCVIQLPEGYIVSKDTQYDFEVLRFRKVRDIFDTGWQSLTVYLGHHPSYFFPNYSFSENQQEKAKGIFLGTDRDWMLFKNEQEPVYVKEQQFPADNMEKDLVIHIGMAADQMNTIEELSRIVATIKFADK